MSPLSNLGSWHLKSELCLHLEMSEAPKSKAMPLPSHYLGLAAPQAPTHRDTHLLLTTFTVKSSLPHQPVFTWSFILYFSSRPSLKPTFSGFLSLISSPSSLPILLDMMFRGFGPERVTHLFLNFKLDNPQRTGTTSPVPFISISLLCLAYHWVVCK